MEVKFIKHPENDIIPKGEPGESVLIELSSPFNPDKPNSKYWLRCHECGKSANLSDHEVQINNGIVNISPSIQCPICPAHYFIRDGKVSDT